MSVHVKKGDTVLVISGKETKERDADGKVTKATKTGEVLRVIPKKGQLVVQGVNLKVKHLKPSMQNPNGGIVRREAPVPGGRVMLVCPSCQKPTRIAHAFVGEGEATKKVRVCKKCNVHIDK